MDSARLGPFFGESALFAAQFKALHRVLTKRPQVTLALGFFLTEAIH
jgi:hypothetical protein